MPSLGTPLPNNNQETKTTYSELPHSLLPPIISLWVSCIPGTHMIYPPLLPFSEPHNSLNEWYETCFMVYTTLSVSTFDKWEMEYRGFRCRQYARRVPCVLEFALAESTFGKLDLDVLFGDGRVHQFIARRYLNLYLGVG